MKVCTDACLFGALLLLENADRILDIGTGTGLLALIAAQRSKAFIEAVEIDPEAAEQAAGNAAKSPWADRIRIYHTPLQQFRPERPYDAIITNPPFFLNSLRSEHGGKRKAKHTDELSFEEVIEFAERHLTPEGILCVLLPEYEQGVFTQLAEEKKLFLSKRWLVRDTQAGKVIRAAAVYSRQKTKALENEVVIKEASGEYTLQFRNLLKDFYLAF